MNLYAYAFKTPSEAGTHRLEGVKVVEITHGEVALVVENIRESERPVTPANILLHDKVVEALWKRGPVLPLQFGVLLSSREEVIGILHIYSNTLKKRLENLRGKVELAVKVFRDPPEGETKCSFADDRVLKPGEYMQRLRDRYGDNLPVGQETRQITSALHRFFLKASVRGNYRTLRTARLVFDGSYLVSEKNVSAFKKQAEHIEIAYENIQLFVTGPWPPYSFCELDLREYSNEE